MATIYNSELTKELINAAKIQTSRDIVPNQLAEKVIPVMEVNPKLLRRTNIMKASTKTTTGTQTVYTAPTDKDFYLTDLQLAWSKDVANDGISAFWVITIDGDSATTNILRLYGQTLTANQIVETISFSNPIKIARGSTLSISHSFTVGASSIAGSLFGYTIDNPNS